MNHQRLWMKRQKWPQIWWRQNRKQQPQLPLPVRSLSLFSISNLSPTTDEVNAIARDVCLSVCLSVCWQDYSKTRSRISMTFCVSTGVGTWTNWSTFEPDPDHSPDAGTGLLSPIAYALQRGILLRQKNPMYCRYWAPVEPATRGFEASKHRCRR